MPKMVNRIFLIRASVFNGNKQNKNLGLLCFTLVCVRKIKNCPGVCLHTLEYEILNSLQ